MHLWENWAVCCFYEDETQFMGTIVNGNEPFRILWTFSTQNNVFEVYPSCIVASYSMYTRYVNLWKNHSYLFIFFCLRLLETRVLDFERSSDIHLEMICFLNFIVVFSELLLQYIVQHVVQYIFKDQKDRLLLWSSSGQNWNYVKTSTYVVLDKLFPSNHNIHKSSCGLCFWASDLLVDRFY